MSRWGRTAGAFLSLIALTATSPERAAADEKKVTAQQCADAYAEAQKTRKEGQLLESREHLVVCAHRSCLAQVRSDCTNWLGEVDAEIPTVVFDARHADGRELRNVEVWVDGERVTTVLDGKAMPLDPGIKKLRFVAEGVGEKTVEVTIRQGEKSRKISVELGKAPKRTDADSGASRPPAQPADAGAASEGPPAAAWVFGGVGLLALGGAGYFWLSAESERSDLEDSCAPNCSQGDKSGVQDKRLFGDIALGVGVVSLTIATVMLVSSPSPEQAARRESWGVDARPLRKGGYASMYSAF